MLLMYNSIKPNNLLGLRPRGVITSSNLMDRQIRLYSLDTILNNELKEKMSWFICGLIDGEGCFHISVVRNKNLKAGWHVKLVFFFRFT